MHTHAASEFLWQWVTHHPQSLGFDLVKRHRNGFSNAVLMC
jgi:hypothetical protein